MLELSLLKKMLSKTHGVLFLKCNLKRKKTAMLFTEDFLEWTEYTKQLILYVIKSVNFPIKSVQFALPYVCSVTDYTLGIAHCVLINTCTPF